MNIRIDEYTNIRIYSYTYTLISIDFLKKKKNNKSDETYFEDIKREIAIMKKLLHPNVLKLYEVLDDPKVNRMYLVLEYMKMGDLVNILKARAPPIATASNASKSYNSKDQQEHTNGKASELNGANNGATGDPDSTSGFQPLSDGEVWHIFRQVVSGIRYLHFQNVVHGDIKPQNLLLGEDGVVKIADFGISQMLTDHEDR